jgi:hypothetical protein
MNLNKLRHLIVIKSGADNLNLSAEDFPLIDEMLNEAQRQFARDTLYNEKSVSITTDTDTLSYQLPEDFIKVRSVTCNDDYAAPADSIEIRISGAASTAVTWTEI